MVIVSNKKENEIFFNFQKSHSQVTNKMLYCYRPHRKQSQVRKSFLITAKEISCSVHAISLFVYTGFSLMLLTSPLVQMLWRNSISFLQLPPLQHIWKIWPYGFWSSTASPEEPVGALITPLNIISTGQKKVLAL